MPPQSLEEQLTKYLTDVHSIEQQALAQMRAAPEIAGDDALAAMFTAHLAETQEQEQRVRARLESRDASPSAIKDIVGTLTGKAFVLFARGNPDTPGKLAAHAFAYEHMELAAYDLLRLVAERAADSETAQMAQEISAQEQAMAQRLSGGFDRAVEASLRELSPDDLGEQLSKYLADAHAIEAQAIQLLERGPQLAGTDALARIYAAHLEQSREHQRLVAQRLEARGGTTSSLKDAALRLGALNWGIFFGAQPDTPAKLAGFAYAFEHLEIGSYELLSRVAQRAGDEQSAALAARILTEERSAAEQIHGQFAAAMDAALEARGLDA